MNHPSQQDLLGYLLGALDAQEQRDLQQEIDNDPSLEEALLDLKAALVPLDCVDNKGYRPGLARRACEAVASWDADSAASQLAFLDHTEIDWEEGCDLPAKLSRGRTPKSQLIRPLRPLPLSRAKTKQALSVYLRQQQVRPIQIQSPKIRPQNCHN